MPGPSTRASTGMNGPPRVSMVLSSALRCLSEGRRRRIRDHQGGGLNLGHRRRRVGKLGLDDGEGAGPAEDVDQIGRRSLGDNDHWT